MSAKLKTITLGCKVNQYETEFIREGLSQIGYVDAQQDETADLCIVNTCTVTNEGDSKSRKVIRQLARENPDSRIVVMGCYATRAPEEVEALPNVAEVVTDKRELPDMLGRFGVVDIPTGISGFGNRHRAYVKVQDGCLLRCSYCIIPHVRPELTSRPMQHILDEVDRLVANGYKELVLTGIHIGHYGVDWNMKKPREEWIRLADLVRSIAHRPGEFRIRISSIEATEVTKELIAVMAEFPEKITPHLHICLQSGSDSVLRRMRRRWSKKTFINRCNLIRKALDNPSFTTDVIVGFPGETEEEFAETLETVREIGFSKIHMFPFSARRGTPAAEMDQQLPKQVKKQRGRELARVENELRQEYFASLIGSELEVLVESQVHNSENQMVGTACRYAPIQFTGDSSLIGSLVKVVAQEVQDDRILASLIE
ncbi:MAG: tRNA (N(6)-L-threonylcarbamoyladenosine(37)-C(2))-methylthiotransferase MtaB [Planctomycetaceae bacterium]